MVDLAHELRRRPNRILTRFLDDLSPTDSRLEVAFLSRVVRRHRLPHPDCQVKVEGLRVDFLWTEQRLIVEIDGRGHDEPSMRAADAVRWADVHRFHERTARQIRQALMTRAP